MSSSSSSPSHHHSHQTSPSSLELAHLPHEPPLIPDPEISSLPTPPLPHTPPTAPQLNQSSYIPPPKSPLTKLTELCDSKAHKMQLEQWQKDEGVFRWLVEQKEEYCSRCQNEIYQLFGYYFVSQGVVFTAVAQSNILRCGDSWSPVSLSLVVFLAGIFAVHHKLAVLAEARRKLQQERDRANALHNAIQDVKMLGIDFDLTKEPAINRPEQGVLNFRKKYVSMYGMAVTITLVTFSALIMVSSVKILCHK